MGSLMPDLLKQWVRSSTLTNPLKYSGSSTEFKLMSKSYSGLWNGNHLLAGCTKDWREEIKRENGTWMQLLVQSLTCRITCLHQLCIINLQPTMQVCWEKLSLLGKGKALFLASWWVRILLKTYSNPLYFLSGLRRFKSSPFRITII